MKKLIFIAAATMLLSCLPVDVYAIENVAISVEKSQSKGIDESDTGKIAVSKMNDLNEIMGVLASSPLYTTDDGSIKNYVKVNRFKSKKSFRSFIKSTCTGELRDTLLKECKSCLKEINGKLYVKNAGRSFFIFRTESGVTISDTVTGDNGKLASFTAKTNDGDEMYGYGTAEFVYNKKWRIKSYKYE